jgi:hypothetical protein
MADKRRLRRIFYETETEKVPGDKDHREYQLQTIVWLETSKSEGTDGRLLLLDQRLYLTGGGIGTQAFVRTARRFETREVSTGAEAVRAAIQFADTGSLRPSTPLAPERSTEWVCECCGHVEPSTATLTADDEPAMSHKGRCPKCRVMRHQVRA